MRKRRTIKEWEPLPFGVVLLLSFACSAWFMVDVFLGPFGLVSSAQMSVAFVASLASLSWTFTHGSGF
jgi:hypothetical protein